MGSCTSKDEKRFHERLLAYFNADDIVTQKFVHGTRRPIDFYIKSIDTYVQFDGVYWHGLDRPIEEIMQHKTKHDKEISSRPASDRQQNEWFKKQGMKLVRVTDVEFTTMLFDEILERIRS